MKLTEIEKNILHIENVDVVDGTPLIDIIPYVREFEDLENVRIGWLFKKSIESLNIKADDRFK